MNMSSGFHPLSQAREIMCGSILGRENTHLQRAGLERIPLDFITSIGEKMLQCGANPLCIASCPLMLWSYYASAIGYTRKFSDLCGALQNPGKTVETWDNRYAGFPLSQHGRTFPFLHHRLSGRGKGCQPHTAIGNLTLGR